MSCFNKLYTGLYTEFIKLYTFIHWIYFGNFLRNFLWNVRLDYIYIYIYNDDKLSAYKMEYSSLTLRSLWQLSIVNHELHIIHVAMRSSIIVLGIRHQPRPYQCSCAGTTLFGRIHALVTQGHRGYPYTQMSHAIRIDNLITIAKENIRTSSLCLAHINAMSIKNKILQFQECITNANIDLCVITETGLNPNDGDIVKVVPQLGCTHLSWPRQDGWRGGGIAIVSKSYINIEEDKDKTEPKTMELLHLSVKVKNLGLNLYTVYRIPNTSILTFCNEMANGLENNIVSDRRETILIGDFNIHMDSPVDPDTINSMTF